MKYILENGVVIESEGNEGLIQYMKNLGLMRVSCRFNYALGQGKVWGFDEKNNQTRYTYTRQVC